MNNDDTIVLSDGTKERIAQIVVLANRMTAEELHQAITLACSLAYTDGALDCVRKVASV